MHHSITGELITLIPQGDLISTTAPAMVQSWKDTLSERTQQSAVHLDLHSVNIIDSQGLNLIIGLYKECSRQKMDFKIVGCSERNQKLFGIFKLNHLLITH